MSARPRGEGRPRHESLITAAVVATLAASSPAQSQLQELPRRGMSSTAFGALLLSLNDGHGSFTPVPSGLPSVASVSAGMQMGDLDGAGDPDLVVANASAVARQYVDLWQQLHAPVSLRSGQTYTLAAYLGNGARIHAQALLIPRLAGAASEQPRVRRGRPIAPIERAKTAARRTRGSTGALAPRQRRLPRVGRIRACDAARVLARSARVARLNRRPRCAGRRSSRSRAARWRRARRPAR